MNELALALVTAVLVEALVEYFKSLWSAFATGQVKTAVTQLAAIAVAIVLCFAAKADVFAALGVPFTYPWIGCLLTGLFASRGANYLSDLIGKLHTTLGAKWSAQ